MAILEIMFILDESGQRTSNLALQVSDINSTAALLQKIPPKLCAPGKLWEEITSICCDKD